MATIEISEETASRINAVKGDGQSIDGWVSHRVNSFLATAESAENPAAGNGLVGPRVVFKKTIGWKANAKSAAPFIDSFLELPEGWHGEGRGATEASEAAKKVDATDCPRDRGIS